MQTRWRKFATPQQMEITTTEFRESCDRTIEALKRLSDDVPELAKRVDDYERGWRSTSGPAEGGGGEGSDTPPDTFGPDVALAIRELLVRSDEAITLVLACDAARARLMPRAKGRDNTVEICPECNRPVVRGKRIDNELFHNESPGTDEHGEALPVCYWARYNRVRGRRG